MTLVVSALFRRGLVLLITAIAAIALSGCNPRELKTQAAQVPELVIASLGQPSTFNYPLNQSAYSVFGFLYEGLTGENGLTGELEPVLAESWTLSEDKLRATFTLREGLKWSDGEPLTVDDVIFTYDKIYLNPKIPTDVRDILRVGTSGALPTVKKLDSRRVEFSVPELFAPFLRYTGGLAILPKHSLEKAVDTVGSDGNPMFLSTWGTDTDPQQIVGNGPYMMESYTPSQRVIFRRNPYYWRKDAQGKTQPYIDRLVYQIIESTDSQILRFRSGELDGLEVAPEAFELLKKEEKRGKFLIYNGGMDLSSTFLSFNLNPAKNSKGQPLVDPIKSRWFNKKEFRQAIAYAIDRQTIKNNIFRGLGELQNSSIYVKSPYYLPPEKGLKIYDYDLEKAKTLLTSAGFKKNDQGQLVDEENHPVRFTLLTNAERKTRVDMATRIKEDLGKLGIQIDLQILSFNPYISKLGDSRDWECYLGGFGGGSIEPYSGNNIWSTKGGLHTFNQGPKPGEKPLQDWKPTDWEVELEQIFTAASQQLDEAKRQELYFRFQKITQEQLPFIYIVNRLSLDAVRDRIQGVKYSALGGPFWNLYELKARIN